MVKRRWTLEQLDLDLRGDLIALWTRPAKLVLPWWVLYPAVLIVVGVAVGAIRWWASSIEPATPITFGSLLQTSLIAMAGTGLVLWMIRHDREAARVCRLTQTFRKDDFECEDLRVQRVVLNGPVIEVTVTPAGDDS